MKFDLVFEGGGAKGNIFIGALEAMESYRLEYRHLVGTSAGSITALLVAAGYSAAEFKQLAQERVNGKPRFATFLDTPVIKDLEPFINTSLTQEILIKTEDKLPNFVDNFINGKFIKLLMDVPAYRELFSLNELGGLYAGEAFRLWIIEKLNNKEPGLGDLTLAEFHARVCAPNNRDLSIVVSDTAAMMRRVLNHRTAPDCPVSWAVRMSMSIPFVWQEVVWQQNWGKYLGENITGNTFVDGGVLSNFPIDLIIQPDPVIMGDALPSDAEKLGLLIDVNLPKDAVVPQQKQYLVDTLEQDILRMKVVTRIDQLIDTMMEAGDNVDIITFAKLICHLPAKGYSTLEFNMSDARLDALINAGKDALLQYLTQYVDLTVPSN